MLLGYFFHHWQRETLLDNRLGSHTIETDINHQFGELLTVANDQSIEPSKSALPSC
jgi:hypothetical protein